MLCRMNPSQALAVRSKCVELCRMPALAISLSLEQNIKNTSESEGDMVAFVSGLLLGNDQVTRYLIILLSVSFKYQLGLIKRDSSNLLIR